MTVTASDLATFPAALPGEPQSDAGDATPGEVAALPWDGDGEMRDGSSAADVVHDNTRRAGFAAHALAAYAQRIGGGGESVATTVRDLLADLCHLADALGLDVDALAEAAAGDHDDEVHGRR